MRSRGPAIPDRIEHCPGWGGRPKGQSGRDGRRRASGTPRKERVKAKDPVCGMQVDEKKAAATSICKGTTYYFCAGACKAAFLERPERYLEKGGCHAEH